MKAAQVVLLLKVMSVKKKKKDKISNILTSRRMTSKLSLPAGPRSLHVQVKLKLQGSLHYVIKLSTKRWLFRQKNSCQCSYMASLLRKSCKSSICMCLLKGLAGKNSILLKSSRRKMILAGFLPRESHRSSIV